MIKEMRRESGNKTIMPLSIVSLVHFCTRNIAHRKCLFDLWTRYQLLSVIVAEMNATNFPDLGYEQS
jgi:hypothetical protein